jgi:hypothetical protein
VGHPKIILTEISEQNILMWFLSHNPALHSNWLMLLKIEFFLLSISALLQIRMNSNCNCSYMAMSSLTYILGFSVRFFSASLLTWLYIRVTRRVSYKKQELLPFASTWVHPILLLIFWGLCCPIMCLYVLSSVLWCLLTTYGQYTDNNIKQLVAMYDHWKYMISYNIQYQFYSLWFDPIGTRTHDVPRSRRVL